MKKWLDKIYLLNDYKEHKELSFITHFTLTMKLNWGLIFHESGDERE